MLGLPAHIHQEGDGSYEKFERVFQAIDTHDDKWISPDEWERFFVKHAARAHADPACAPPAPTAQMLAKAVATKAEGGAPATARSVGATLANATKKREHLRRAVAKAAAAEAEAAVKVCAPPPRPTPPHSYRRIPCAMRARFEQPIA